MPDRSNHYAESASNPSVSFGEYTTLNGRTVELKTTPNTDTIALVWDDGGVDLFEITAVDVFIDLFIRAVATARNESPETDNRLGTVEEERDRLKELQALLKKQKERIREAKRQRKKKNAR